MKLPRFFLGVVVFIGFLLSGFSALSQGTAFTYQGRLTDNGAPASGVYDLRFSIYDAAIGNGLIAGPITNSATLVSNGFFTVILEFGGGVMTGPDRWLDIRVRTNGAVNFSILSPRQKLTPAPYAITAGNLTGTLPAVQLIGTVPASGMGSFTNHNDVILSGLAAGQTLIYSGTIWTNGPQPPTGFGGVPVTLGFSGTNVAVNALAGTHFRLVATTNFLLQNPTGASDSQRLVFEIIQDATGGRTMALGNAFKLGTDIPLVNLSTNANRRDFLTCICSGTNFYVVGFVKGY